MIATILFIVFFSYINVKNLSKTIYKTAKWILTFSIVAVLTSELDHLFVIKSFGSGIPLSTILSETHYFYYSLFWMISAFIISLSSLLFKDHELIRIGMFFLLAVIIKSFIFDMPELTIGQQIITFSTLGFIILFTAFVRQRIFEKIIFKKE